jgi:hypothetical protein
VHWAPHIGVVESLAVIVSVLAVTTVASLLKVRSDPSAAKSRIAVGPSPAAGPPGAAPSQTDPSGTGPSGTGRPGPASAGTSSGTDPAGAGPSGTGRDAA